MTIRAVVGGLLSAMVVAGTVALAAPAAEAQCEGRYDAKSGSNFAPCPPASKVSLYRRLGGREGIAGLVDDFVANVVADPRVNGRFKGLQPPAVFKLKSNLADQICEAAGGPCSYLGRDMKTTHAGMKITEAEWNATVENLVKALDKRKVDAASRQELLGLLGSMKKDIVGQ
ncbi:MAG TPA: group 1 truncated hemoglobin [Candidatus Tectomicrobia bacterium]|nr:group 1 truncated hemoglobin [Candidatus Tectomicrobia bacterium]